MSLLKVEVTKGKTVVDIDTKDFPDNVHMEALRQGYKVLLNRGMTKITKELYPNEEELKAAAMAKAATTLEDMKAGKIRIVGGGKDKVSGAVKTEAMRMARALVKEEMKRQKIKVSYVEASVITAAAQDILRVKPEIIEKAKEAIAAREAEAAALKEGLAQIVTPGMISEKKKAKAEKEKAEAKAATQALSATQAGIPAQRAAAKPKGGQTAGPKASA